MHPTANVCQTKESLFAVRIRLLGSVNEEVSIQVTTVKDACLWEDLDLTIWFLFLSHILSVYEAFILSDPCQPLAGQVF